MRNSRTGKYSRVVHAEIEPFGPGGSVLFHSAVAFCLLWIVRGHEIVDLATVSQTKIVLPRINSRHYGRAHRRDVHAHTRAGCPCAWGMYRQSEIYVARGERAPLKYYRFVSSPRLHIHALAGRLGRGRKTITQQGRKKKRGNETMETRGEGET